MEVIKFMFALLYLAITGLIKAWKYVLFLGLFIFILWVLSIGSIIVLQVIGG